MNTEQTGTAWWCEDCQQITEPTRVYECSTCGEADEERRCSQCNRFKARREEDGCESCYAEVHEIETVVDHDGTVIPSDQFDPDGPSLADRAEAKKQADAAAAKARHGSKQATLLAASRETTWGQVNIGDAVLTDDFLADRFLETLPTVCAITPAEGRKIIALKRYGITYTNVHDDDPVRVATDHTPDTDDDDRPFGVFDLQDEAPFASSSPVEHITIEVGQSTKNNDQPGTQVIEFRLDGGNIGYVLGYWYDPAMAAAALDVLHATAVRLAAALGEALDPDRGAEQVDVVEKEWLYHSPVSWVGVRVGQDDFQPKHRAIAAFSINGNHNASFSDPHVLAAAVAQARSLIPRLVRP